jgi:hypothetical protein
MKPARKLAKAKHHCIQTCYGMWVNQWVKDIIHMGTLEDCIIEGHGLGF